MAVRKALAPFFIAGHLPFVKVCQYMKILKASPSLTAVLMEKQKELHEEALSEILQDADDAGRRLGGRTH
ncbi:hypothetical protein HDV05_004795 [Chytridiales sp. JEL 0842]|nr:hypothetical protein HDV05_004795 [Chytridiales sp. JEL 0842]